MRIISGICIRLYLRLARMYMKWVLMTGMAAGCKQRKEQREGATPGTP